MDFIDGVILIEECTSLSKFWTIALIAIATAPMIITLIIAIVLVIIKDREVYEEKFEDFIKKLTFVSMGWGFIVVVSMLTPLYDPLYEPDGCYIVVVTEDTDMNEFVEKYEILDYENGKYTIRMK